MSRHATAGVLLPILLPVVLFLAGSARAQVTSYVVNADLDGANRPALSVQVRCPAPTGKPSGLGFARVELENVSHQALDLQVSTRQGYGTGGFEASHRETLERGATARLCLPVMGESPVLRVEVAGRGNYRALGSGGGMYGVAVLHVGTEAATLDWRTLLEAEFVPSGTPAPGVSARARRASTQLPNVTPDDLPPDARWLSGYDLILLDAGVAGLSGEIQERLVQYVAGGGALLLYQGEALAPGPLATMAATTTPGRHGLGSWLRIEGGSDAALEQKLRPWLRHPAVGPMLGRELPMGSPARSGLHSVLRIPGLGEVPVWGFLLLIAGFVAFVVRQILGVLRKRVRPMRMLLVLPVTGVSFALLILGYGLFSEGFAIRGIMWSFTRLDQRNHTAAGVATRTLYAGLSPSELIPSPDTLLLGSAQQIRGGHHGPELRLDMDRGGRVANSILPSRTMTGLVTTTVGRARERLRFRRRTDGLEVLAGPELRPCGTAQAVLLRDFAGRTFVQSAPGQLTPVADPLGERLTAAHESLERMQFLSPSRIRRHGPTPPGGVKRSWSTDWLEGQIGDQLAPGTYLAWVEAPPAFDSLGLDVEYRDCVHLVLGILAPEDILE